MEYFNKVHGFPIVNLPDGKTALGTPGLDDDGAFSNRAIYTREPVRQGYIGDATWEKDLLAWEYTTEEAEIIESLRSSEMTAMAHGSLSTFERAKLQHSLKMWTAPRQDEGEPRVDKCVDHPTPRAVEEETIRSFSHAINTCADIGVFPWGEDAQAEFEKEPGQSTPLLNDRALHMWKPGQLWQADRATAPADYNAQVTSTSFSFLPQYLRPRGIGCHYLGYDDVYHLQASVIKLDDTNVPCPPPCRPMEDEEDTIFEHEDGTRFTVDVRIPTDDPSLEEISSMKLGIEHHISRL